MLAMPLDGLVETSTLYPDFDSLKACLHFLEELQSFCGVESQRGKGTQSGPLVEQGLARAKDMEFAMASGILARTCWDLSILRYSASIWFFVRSRREP